MSENKYTEEFFEEYERKMNMANKINSERDAAVSDRKPKRKRHRIALAMLSLILVAILLIGNLWPDSEPVPPENTGNTASDVIDNKEEEKKSIFKVSKTENTAPFAYNIVSEYGIMIDSDTGEIIYEKNADTKIFPASLTKILTLLVAVENITDLNKTFQMTAEIIDPHYREGASMAGFAPDEVISARDLLYGSILPSGADATTAIGIFVAGTEEHFAELMNKKAEELGLTTAHFCNTSGLHDPDHYCTVKDMALILKAAMDNETCREILSTYKYTTAATPQNPQGLPLVSTMFSRMTGEEPEGATILGGKTGFTDQAGNCLASFGKSDSGRNVIMVTVKAQGMWKSVFDHIHTYSTLTPKSDIPTE